MTKANLVDQVHRAVGPGLSRRECGFVINAFLEAVKQAMVRGDNIEIRGFATFKVEQRQARKRRNPRTGEAVHVPAHHVPVVRPSNQLKDQVARSHGAV